MIPSPLQASQRPPFTLKLNLPFPKPLIFASGKAANRSLILVNIPVYVAGFDRGVLPIGLWSMSITLSMFSRPKIASCSPAFAWVRLIIDEAPLLSISLIRLLLPDPETPVTHTSSPRGISTSMFLRLFARAPLIEINLPFPSLRCSGSSIFFAPDRYCPVIEFGFALISSAVPWATTIPPWIPAPGPISTIWSAAYIVSSSCSTTIKVLPISVRCLSVAKSLSLSLWWSPMLGSSSM